MLMLFEIIDKKHLSQDEIFKDRMSIEECIHAFHSIDSMKMLITQVTSYFNKKEEEKTDECSQIKMITNYIHDHIENDIRRSDIAGSVFLTEDYLSHMFKEKMGISLKEYIIQEKMKLASHLLHTTNLSVSVIAKKLGYSHFSHFTQTYTRVMGTTPTEERQKAQIKAIL
jgi:two-component system response regulator YesN